MPKNDWIDKLTKRQLCPTKKSVDPSEDSAAFYNARCKYQRSSLSKGHDDKQNQSTLFKRYLIISSFEDLFIFTYE